MWLGEESEDSHLAMNMPSTMSVVLTRPANRMYIESGDLQAILDQLECTFITSPHPKEVHLKLLAVGQLFHRPWFERMWVIQVSNLAIVAQKSFFSCYS